MPVYIPSSDLKTIFHSKHINLYCLEYCRIPVSGGRVECTTKQKGESLYWSIPIVNTTYVLLGTGTSVIQVAVRELSKAGMVIGFYGGGGTPLFAGCEIESFSPQSEYRPTEYLRCWCGFRFGDAKRLAAAKHLQAARLETVTQIWFQTDWQSGSDILNGLLRRYEKESQTAPDNQSLLVAGGHFATKLCSITNWATLNDATFRRSTRGEGDDTAGEFLDYGSYLAYGLDVAACWALSLPHGLAVLHGKTQHDGLIFDVVDIVKDTLTLPQAFISAAEGDNEREFRQRCVERLVHSEALNIIIDAPKPVAAESLKQGRAAIIRLQAATRTPKSQT